MSELNSVTEQNKFPAECPCCLSHDRISFLCKAGKKKQYSFYQCFHCGFQFTYPAPSEEDLAEFYKEESYYSGNSASNSKEDDPGDYQDYDKQIEYTLIFFRDVLKSLALPAKSRMLDVGCAKGRYMELARGEFDYCCSGVELSDYAREYTKKHYNGAFPVWRSLQEMPLQENPFDLILLFDVIEHVDNPWQLLLELFRHGCVGRNTTILITTPNCRYKDAIDDPENWRYRYPPAHLSFCAPETFQKIGETLLFQKIDISAHSLLPDHESLLQEMLEKEYYGYDGLFCSFSGSFLGEIPPEKIPGSLKELKNSSNYLALLGDYLFSRNNVPNNPEFKTYLRERVNRFIQEKVSADNSYGELSKHYANLESGWKELKSLRDQELLHYQEQFNRHSLLEKEYLDLTNAEKRRNEELANQNVLLDSQAKELTARLEQELANSLAMAEKNTLLEQKNIVLEDQKSSLEQKNTVLEDQKSSLEEDFRKLGRNNYTLWTQSLKILQERNQCRENNAELKQKKEELIGSLNDMTAWKDALESARIELTNQNLFLDRQLNDMTAWKDVLESARKELTNQNLSLDRQLKEIMEMKAQLERDFAEVSAKLNMVSCSNSYRIGRVITYPVRKSKAVLASIREKINKCRLLKEKCGSAYVGKCIFRKLVGKEIHHAYDTVSSIGVNCEISFNLVRVNGSVDSYPLIWSFVHTLKPLAGLLSNPMILAEDQEMKHDYSCNMVRYPRVDISFHCKGHAESILGEDGKVDEGKAQAERDELKSRLTYLAQKWENTLKDPSKKVLCILTAWEEYSTTEEILAVYDSLQKYPSVELLVVLTGKEKSVSPKALKGRKGLYVRYITHHPPHDKVTDEKENDIKGWNRICDEFRPLMKKSSNKVYKYEH